jgi:hypothetical protein
MLEEFDQWYPTFAIGASSNLAGEWPLFTRNELDNAVTLARANLYSIMMVEKKSFAGAVRSSMVHHAVNVVSHGQAIAN